MRSNIVRTASGARVTSTLREQPTRAEGLLAALRGLEEGGERLQVRRPLVRERRHRAARLDARRALQVGDLEGDALVLRALVAEVGRTEVVAADAEVGVAVEAADDGEELGTAHRLGVAREMLLLRPGRHVGEVLGAERLLRGRATVGEHPHRDHDEDGADHRDERHDRVVPHRVGIEGLPALLDVALVLLEDALTLDDPVLSHGWCLRATPVASAPSAAGRARAQSGPTRQDASTTAAR